MRTTKDPLCDVSHAPTCLRMEIWNNDTDTLLCRQEPVYGGTGKIDINDFDEPGYIGASECCWVAASHCVCGLVSGTSVHVGFTKRWARKASACEWSEFWARVAGVPVLR